MKDSKLTEDEALILHIIKTAFGLLFLIAGPMVVINAMQAFGVDVELTWKTWWHALMLLGMVSIACNLK